MFYCVNHPIGINIKQNSSEKICYGLSRTQMLTCNSLDIISTAKGQIPINLQI